MDDGPGLGCPRNGQRWKAHGLRPGAFGPWNDVHWNAFAASGKGPGSPARTAAPPARIPADRGARAFCVHAPFTDPAGRQGAGASLFVASHARFFGAGQRGLRHRRPGTGHRLVRRCRAGDPDLITVKGRSLIERAGAILFAGSLVDETATRWAPPGCTIADSKSMTLDQMAAWLVLQAQKHRTVVRLQTGDPALYGALVELVQPLDAAGVPVRVVPGVSSAMASAAAAVESFTLPEVTQTVVFTRVEGRTPMPPGESLAELARHRCTLCIFLSITLLHKVQAGLREAGWPDDAPLLVVHKASWPGEERIVRCTVADVRERCREARVVSQAMIIASPTLGARHWPELAKSKLYDPGFTHRFRRASDAPLGADAPGSLPHTLSDIPR